MAESGDNKHCLSLKYPQGLPKSDAEWKTLLTPGQYRVLRMKETEPAFSGHYAEHHEHGAYHCAACDAVLFRSEDKFDSGTGWPSFSRSACDGNIGFREDRSCGMHRTEVFCKSCAGHLGHVFDDGPSPGGKRFCINSCSLQFRK